MAKIPFSLALMGSFMVCALAARTLKPSARGRINFVICLLSAPFEALRENLFTTFPATPMIASVSFAS